MKTAVIYTSKTGFTRRYAQWIAGAVGADCLELKQARDRNFSEYDAIVFGGWVCAATVRHLDWFVRQLPRWTGKRLIAFAVGGSPAGSPDIPGFMEKTFGTEALRAVSAFYCPGGLSYENMGAPSRAMMKLFVRSVAARKDKKPHEEEAARMMAHSYDLSDRKYIEPILALLRDGGEDGQQ